MATVGPRKPDECDRSVSVPTEPARDRTASIRLPGFGVLAGGMIAATPRAAMASWHLRVSKAPSAVTLSLSWPGGIWSGSSGNMGASPTSLEVNSAARIARDFLSISMWILHCQSWSAIGSRTIASATSGAPMFAGVPFTFALDLDCGAVDRQAQRAF